MINGKKVLRTIGIVMCTLVILVIAVISGVYFYGKWSVNNNTVFEETVAEPIVLDGKTYTYKENLINILCMGIDKEEQMAIRNDAEHSIGQADAIFLVSMDLEKEEIRIIAVPRDTMVTLQMFDGSGAYMGSGSGQITLQYAYADGLERSAKLTVSQVSSILNDIPINAYAAINVFSLWNLNAAIGGVDMYMDEDYTMFNPAFVKGTTVHLEEHLLENYIRGRDKQSAGTAYTRIHRLKKYMQAYFEKAKVAIKEDMAMPFRALKALEKDMETDITAAEIPYLALKALSCKISEENIYTLPGEQVQGEQYEEFYLDEDAVDALVLKLFYEEN